MAKFQSGRIVVVCKTSVEGATMQKMIANFGLKFSDCCVQGDFYFIEVESGTEEQWVKKFSEEPGVFSVTRLPDFSSC